MKYNAVITAGGLITGEFAEIAGTNIKAMIKINDRSLLLRTTYALKESSCVNKIALVAPEEIRNSDEAKGIDHFIPAHQSGVENILRGLLYYKNDSKVIFCTSDLPFINPHSVSDFVQRCVPDAGICYPVFEKNEIKSGIRPGIPSYIKLKDGFFTGGSIFLLDVNLCLSRMKAIGESFNSRKSIPGMAMLLGPGIMLKFLFGICSIEDIMKRAEEIIKGKCLAIRGCDPSITVDIDDVKSYNFALRYENNNSGQKTRNQKTKRSI